ncbi:hypothetical protein KCU65_g6536, partial [Aureobasidium melanogenum]
MAEPPTVIDLSKDNQASHQAPDTTLRKLIAIDQDFAEDLAHQAVGEIEKLWPDLKAERFASQDIVELSTTLRTAKINLEFRMLRALLVIWKDHLMKRPGLSSQEMIEIAVVINRLVPLQLGPAKKQSSAADFTNASEVDGSQDQSCTTDHYLEQYDAVWPDVLYDIFHQRWLDDDDYVKGREECRSLWPDLEEELVPTVKQLKMMARDLCAAHFPGLEFRLLRAFVVGWMFDPSERLIVADGKRASKIRKMALAQMGPKNMVIHNDGIVSILRKKVDKDYDTAEDSDLDDEERDQAKRHKLVTETLYPRNRPTLEKKRESEARAHDDSAHRGQQVREGAEH